MMIYGFAISNMEDFQSGTMKCWACGEAIEMFNNNNNNNNPNET